MNLNRAYLDPPKYGWTAIGGISDILEPHEAARRGIVAPPANDTSNTPQPYYTILEEEKKEEEETKPPVQEEEGQRSRRKKKEDTNPPEDKSIENNETNPSSSNEPPPKQIVLNPTFTIHTYHRGRIGHEPRDSNGELLAPTNAIDTNHDWRPINPIVSLTLDFPLDDTGHHKFHDTIDYDLNTNLEEFVTQLSVDYNLSFRTTMELMESLSNQIAVHVRQIKYYPPMIIKDVYDNDRPDKQFGEMEDVMECFGRREEEEVWRGQQRRGRQLVTIKRGERRNTKKEKGERKVRPMGTVKPQRGSIEVGFVVENYLYLSCHY
jgi:hypothetical protein